MKEEKRQNSCRLSRCSGSTANIWISNLKMVAVGTKLCKNSIMETIIDEFTNLAQRAITSNLLLGFSENLRGQNTILIRNLKEIRRTGASGSSNGR